MITALANIVQALRTDRQGATAIEYGVIAASIIVVCLVAIQLVGTNLQTTFNSVAGAL